MIFQPFTTESDLNNITVTIEEAGEDRSTSLSLYGYIIPVIGLFVIVINLAVVISSGLILKRCQNPRSTYLLLGNVAMSDLLTGIAVIFGKIYPIHKRDRNVCAIEIGLIISSTLASVYSVGLIAVDRYLYILYGMQYQRWVYCKRVRVFIAMSWVIGCVVGFLPLMGYYGDTNDGATCWFILLAPKPLILLTVNVGILPLLLVLILYSIISYRAIQKIVQFQKPEHHEDGSPRHIRMFRGKNVQREETARSSKGIFKIFKTTSRPFTSNKWKSVKVVVFTTLIFMITWLPYYVTSLSYVIHCNHDTDEGDVRCKKIRELIASPLAILGFFNSLLNPLVYAWWHKGFRENLRRRWEITVLNRKSKLSLKSDNRNTSITSVRRNYPIG